MRGPFYVYNERSSMVLFSNSSKFKFWNIVWRVRQSERFLLYQTATMIIQCVYEF